MNKKYLIILTVFFGILFFISGKDNYVFAGRTDYTGCFAYCGNASYKRHYWCDDEGWCSICDNYDCSATTTSCGSCSVSCGGGTQYCSNYDSPCGGDCGGGGWQACNTQACCTNSAPAQISLSSPASGTTGTSSGPTLTWNAETSWGTNCSGNTNTYKFYLGTSSPPSLNTSGISSTTTSKAVSGLSWGTTYYWNVAANNGYADSTLGSPWSFTTNASSVAPTVSAPTNGATNVSRTPAINLSATDADGDYIRYKVQLATDAGFTANLQTFDQTSSQTGWSGQNAQGTPATAYTSGATATYTIQSALSHNTTYYLRAYAIDPGGTNTWSSTSSTISFTTGTFYNTSASIQSTNLLTGASDVALIASFVYNLSAKPAGTTATIQFSQDASTWKNSAGTIGGTDTLSTGTNNSINLSGLNWSGANFYYKVAYTSDGSGTPVLDDVQVNYNNSTSNTAYSSGATASYTIQSALSTGTTYYLRGYAKDPAGSNAWSAASSTNSFTTNASPAGPTISAPTYNATRVSTTPVISLSVTDTNSDYVRYKIQLCTDSSFTQSCQTFDQTTSQTGWSGQNAQTSTAYNSGSTATYTVQSALTGKRYFLRAYGIDPAGTNVWGSASSTWTFLTTNVTPGPCTSQSGGDINIGENCNFTGGFEGADAGNLTIKAGSAMTVNANQSLIWNPGQAITIEAGAQIIVNSSAKMTQSYMFTPSSGSSAYPDPIGFYGAVAAYHMDDSCGCTTTGCTGNTYCSGGMIFNSTGSNNGTAVGTTITSGKMGNARSFNGSSEYISLPAAIRPAATNAYTVAAFIHRSNTGVTQWIMGNNNSTGGFEFGIDVNNKLYCNKVGVTGGAVTGNTALTDTSANKWYFVSCVLSTTGMTLYLDGSADGSNTNTANVNDYNAALFLGARNLSGSANGYFNGVIDELQIFNRTLAASTEMTGLYNPSSGGATFIYQSTNPDASAYRRRKDISSGAVPIGEWKLDEQTGALVNTAP